MYDRRYGEQVWSFKTKNFLVALYIEPQHNYQYDGDDEDGETQRLLDNGEYIAFDSIVIVKYKGCAIGRDTLGSSVYSQDNYKEFWQAHRDPNPLNRNCTIMRKAYSQNSCISHYFPGMVREAISDTRQALNSIPHLRK
jgi:hypothetical protein